jgi:hypothetical protein
MMTRVKGVLVLYKIWNFCEKISVECYWAFLSFSVFVCIVSGCSSSLVPSIILISIHELLTAPASVACGTHSYCLHKLRFELPGKNCHSSGISKLRSRVQSRVTLCGILAERSDTRANFSTTFFGFPLLIAIQPLLLINVLWHVDSLPRNYCIKKWQYNIRC